ncbi:MAG TPA: glycosyltransferase [Candidatus Saccharimonadales bacterium]|nr:glycosyltransferase [Candidatus Saccharimonadales bacterium]
MPAQKLKVAIVHDWLYGGGAERVVYQLHQLYPDAPIYTSYCSDEWRQRLDNKVITGFLQHQPFKSLRKVLPVLRIWWFTHLDLSGYDLVISSSGNGEAKGVRVPQTTTHICYCHTPTHFYWRHYQQYLDRPGFGAFNPIVRLGLRLLVGSLRRWDYKAAQRPDYFIANSTHIQKDIKTYYGRDAVVIHPPVEVERFAGAEAPAPRHGFITADRHVAAKRIDIIVAACTRLGLQLTVVGSGPETKRLKALAGPTVTFTGFLPEADVPTYFAGAQAFIKASFEDFGVVPVEAMAAGTPVIAYKAGGAQDYVIPGKTGILYDTQTVDSLSRALKAFDAKKFHSKTIQAAAAQFSAQAFQTQIHDFVTHVLAKKG